MQNLRLQSQWALRKSINQHFYAFELHEHCAHERGINLNELANRANCLIA